MTALSYPAIYGPFIILASLPGGWLPSLVALRREKGAELPTDSTGRGGNGKSFGPRLRLRRSEVFDAVNAVLDEHEMRA